LSDHVRFSITEKPDWRNAAGFLIGLDEKSNGNKNVLLKYCSKIVDGSSNDKCETGVKQVRKIIFNIELEIILILEGNNFAKW